MVIFWLGVPVVGALLHFDRLAKGQSDEVVPCNALLVQRSLQVNEWLIPPLVAHAPRSPVCRIGLLAPHIGGNPQCVVWVPLRS